MVGSIKGIEIVEMSRNGTKGMCCGAGGARMWMEESIGTKVNDERALEAISTGATRVATACPFCYIMLDDGVKAAGKEEEDVKVADLAIHLLDAIEAGEAKMGHPDAPLNVPIETPLRVPGFAGHGSTATATIEAPAATERRHSGSGDADDLKLLIGIGPCSKACSTTPASRPTRRSPRHRRAAAGDLARHARQPRRARGLARPGSSVRSGQGRGQGPRRVRPEERAD